MKSDSSYQSLCDLIPPLLPLCRQAGDVITEHYRSPHASEFQSKGDDSPLTQADLASDAVLQAGLCALDPIIPVLSEESAPEVVAQRHQWHRYWLVDPLDGTREFLDRTGEFTINIALIEGHRPVLGVLYQPLEQVAYIGIPGVLAQRYEFRGSQPGGVSDWISSGLATRALREGQTLQVMASRRHRGPKLGACLEWLEAHWGPLGRSNSGSALKFSQMAAGLGDFYPRFTPCCEWDTAAGQALLEAAGGCLLGMDGQPLQYNRSDSLMSPHFYGLADAQHILWQRLLARGST